MTTRSNAAKGAVACFAIMAIVAAIPTRAHAQDYDIINIPLPENLTDGCEDCNYTKCAPDDASCEVIADAWHLKAYAVNKHGEVVGTANQSVGPCFYDVGFVWLPKPKYGLTAGTHFLKDHDPVEDLATFAYDINDAGIIVGQVGFCIGCDAMIWDLNGADPLVGMPMAASTDTAWAVNNASAYEIAGTYSGDRAFVWHSGSGTFDVFLPQGGWARAAAFDLSTPPSGEPLVVAGWSESVTQGTPPCIPASDAVAWTGGVPEILDQPVGFYARGNEIRGGANGVNDDGVTVGFGRYDDQMGDTRTCIDYALRWNSATAAAVNLGAEVTDPTDASHAHAINPPGDIVVGENLDASEAALWVPDNGGQLYLRLCDLTPDAVCSGMVVPSGYWRLWVARDINPCDYICGWGDFIEPDCFGPRTNAYLAILPPLLCPADTDGNGAVDVVDLVNVVLAWGTSNPNADVNDDGLVDVQDLVAVILAWGVCPCNITAPDPDSLAQELQEGGLTWDDWNDFVNNHFSDPNYRCWMAYHLVGGTPNCPGPDPWGN